MFNACASISESGSARARCTALSATGIAAALSSADVNNDARVTQAIASSGPGGSVWSASMARSQYRRASSVRAVYQDIRASQQRQLPSRVRSPIAAQRRRAVEQESIPSCIRSMR